MLSSSLSTVLLQLLQFDGGFVRQASCSPDLTVRVRVRAAHGCAFVLEDLHVPVLGVWGWDGWVAGGWERGWRCGFCERGAWGEVRGVDVGPSVDYGKDLLRGEIGEGEVVGG